MGDLPLTLDLFVRRAVRLFPDKEVRSAGPGGIRATTYEQWAERVGRYGSLLDQLGASPDARVGSLCWSTVEHLELYFGVPGTGRVLHTMNPRFSPDQLAAVIEEGGDEIVFVHRSLASRLAELPSLGAVRHVVLVDDGGGHTAPDLAGVEVADYETLMAAAPSTAGPVVDDERRAAVLCHTGGTTGDPKGVLYSHRSLVLHAMATTSAGGIGIHERDVVMPVVPLFHANAVGFAHAAVGTGATLVLPGPDLSGPTLARLIEEEAVTVTCGVPTIWAAVLPHLSGRPVPELRTIISGASAVPPSLSESFRQQVGIPLTQLWGMTETSPFGTVVSVVSSVADRAPAELAELRSTIGVPTLGIETRIVDGDGGEVPWDGESSGELEVRGPWVASAYFGGRSPESFTEDGWLRTGDVVVGDPHGYLRVVDRLKDVIKSGGEWISSIRLENLLMSHPAILEAAVVAVDDERWGERPLAYVVLRDGAAAPGADELSAYLAERVPSWWIPDRFDYLDEIPKTPVGKFSKSALRDLATEPRR